MGSLLALWPFHVLRQRYWRSRIRTAERDRQHYRENHEFFCGAIDAGAADVDQLMRWLQQSEAAAKGAAAADALIAFARARYLQAGGEADDVL